MESRAINPTAAGGSGRVAGGEGRRAVRGRGSCRRGGWPKPAGALSLAGVAVVALLFGPSCFLDPREPDPPTEVEVPFDSPVTPQTVLKNMRVALNAKSVTTYERSLSDDYRFRPDPSDSLQVSNPAIFNDFNKAEERNAWTQIFADTTKVRVTVAYRWNPPSGAESALQTQPADDGTNGQFFKDLAYEIKFTKTGTTVIFGGRVDLYLREDAGLWSVYRWKDERDETYPTTSGRLRHDRVVF